MTADRYTHRVRLYRGRNTHAAPDPLYGDYETACGRDPDARAANHWMPPTTPVTCTACNRKIAKETS
ncbi:hypothetical protein [Streptomyces clavuligerus]|uniref:hypothetical protein n=1 Tax=Streptomyces clavuligerus TaxID=1901 RepID=UPI00018008B9|nr:hypothetical protein [Streptomyces clavuligerus]EDY52985.1 hypothetical protein SSCG_06067 [Streptomyces clavuligerus]WDN56000.1 DUF4121 family protein [Streptomyces clavuligerus]